MNRPHSKEKEGILEEFVFQVEKKQFKGILKEFDVEPTEENIKKYFNYNQGLEDLLKEQLLNQLYSIEGSIERSRRLIKTIKLKPKYKNLI